MQWRQLYDKLFAIYGDCHCPLIHESPFQLLAAVMLSAQCKDERVNVVTRGLFALAPDAPSMAALEEGFILEDDELKGARKTLTAAALTYVAALAVSLMQFLRLLAIVLRGRGKRR